MKIGTLVAFISYQGMMTGMISQLANVAATYGAAAAGLEQIYEVLDEEPTVVESPDAVTPESPKGRITFENIHFAYEQDKPVMNGVTVDIPAGQSVALVGPSGGGKSTFANLLLRLYDPDAGSIRLDSRDIKELSLSDYRSLFGVVLQEPFLFNETIYDNLKAVKTDATDEEIRDALTRAQAWDFVNNLNGGWDFKVGEGGSQLSGGQRQRIALARCILTDPKIMVLDEATSALDNQSEALVQTALEEMMHSRTVVVIAHRLSTVRNVDRILVLKDGRIVQDGNFDQLCREPGLFRDLHLLTMRGVAPE
jgi:ABC-type multidrug transport system fused ATPase/permease subunit